MTARAEGLVSLRGLAVAGAGLSVAALYGAFAYVHTRAFLEQPRPSLVLLVVFETLFALFLMIRRPAEATSTSLADWASTLAGMVPPLLLRPTPSPDVPWGEALQALGFLVAIAGIASLNRSVGLLPANRGIRDSGVYRLVRHPLYSAYFVAYAGYLCTHHSAWNVALVVAHALGQMGRIRREERLLARDPQYVSYMARTRWRLLPGLY